MPQSIRFLPAFVNTKHEIFLKPCPLILNAQRLQPSPLCITPVVNAVIALAATVVSVFLIPWIKSKTTAQQRSELVAWAKIGVAAAEQIYVGQGRGDEKKQYVLEFLKSKGFDLNEESVNNAIEAAVKQLNTEGLLID